MSAHDALRRAHDQAESIATLAGEYQTIAKTTEQDRWETLLARSGLNPTQLQSVKNSPAYPALSAALTDAAGVEGALAGLVAQRTLINADGIAAVLCHRVDAWAKTRPPQENLVAGLIPRAAPTADADLARGLDEREHAIEARATTLAEHAATSLRPWIANLGRPPTDPLARSQWLQAVKVVAAYRDRWDIKDDPHPLGPETTTSEQAQQRKRALAAARRAFTIARNPQLIAPSPYAATAQIEQRGIEL